MKPTLFLLLFLFSALISCSASSNDRRARYDALKKQKAEETQAALPSEAEQAKLEADLRAKMGGQANLDAAKKKLADYIASIGGEEGVRLRIEKIGQEAFQREIQTALHGVPQEAVFMTQLGIWVGLLILLALPITRNEIVSVLTYIQELFAVDRRGVLCFRVSLGFVVVVDALQRMTEATVFYSEYGVFTREMAFVDQGVFQWSLYFANGHLFWAYFMLTLTALAGACLVVGYASRTWSVVAWVLVSSLHVRSPHVCNAGDAFLRIALLWASFLPLSDLLSVDNYLVNRSRVYTPTIATTTTITNVSAAADSLVDASPRAASATAVEATAYVSGVAPFLSDDFPPTPTNVLKKEVIVLEPSNSSASSASASSSSSSAAAVAAVSVKPSYVVGSLAAVGILLQLVWFYHFTARTQESRSWTEKENYSAVYFLLSAPSLTHPSAATIVELAHSMQWSATVLKILRAATIGINLLEKWGVLLLLAAPLLCLVSYNLSPVRDLIRSIILLALTVLNVALLLTAKLGPLPVVMLATQSLFTPSWVFNVFAKCTPTPSTRLSWAWKLQSHISPPVIHPLQGDKSTVVVYTQPVYLRPRSWLSRAFCVFLIVHSAWLNFGDSSAEVHEILQDVLGHRQVWTMFQEETEHDAYMVMPAKLKGHTEQFDMQQAFAKKEVKVGFFPLVHLDSIIPHLSAPFYDSHRWTTYMLLEDHGRAKRLAEYICYEWNKVNQGSNSLETIDFFWVGVKVKQPKLALTGAKKSVGGTELIYEHVCDQ